MIVGLYIRCAEIGGISGRRTGEYPCIFCGGEDRRCLRRIDIHYGSAAAMLGEELQLTFTVVFVARMLVFAYVVGIKVCEDADIEFYSVKPIEKERLRRCLYHGDFYAAFLHERKVEEDLAALGRCVYRIVVMIEKIDAVRAYISGLPAAF